MDLLCPKPSSESPLEWSSAFSQRASRERTGRIARAVVGAGLGSDIHHHTRILLARYGHMAALRCKTSKKWSFLVQPQRRWDHWWIYPNVLTNFFTTIENTYVPWIRGGVWIPNGRVVIRETSLKCVISHKWDIMMMWSSVQMITHSPMMVTKIIIAL